MGSLFIGRVLRILAETLQPGTPLTDRLFAWPGDISANGASVPLRLAGAFHSLTLDGSDPDLAKLYPPNEADDAALTDALARALTKHEKRISHWLDSPPQTNEVGRSAVLIAVGHWLADRYGLPLILSELGASAGLNLNWDRFALQIGADEFGPIKPLLTLAPDWSGAPPHPTTPIVIGRRGVDLKPLTLSEPDAELRLLSYVWPDQPERLARTKAAIKVAKDLMIDRADAADWLAKRLSAPLSPDVPACHLIYHTVAWQYFPPDVQARATALIEAAGAQATETAPLAWFGMEADGQSPGAGLILRLWPGDLRFNFGRADFHCRWVDWRPEELM